MTQTPYIIKVAPPAERHLALLPIKEKKIIFKLIDSLAINPRPPGAKKIDGMTGLYSEEIESMHIVYKIEEQEVLVLLVQ